MAAFTVIAAGPAPTVQDLGRPSFQHLGVPVSGALDPVALWLANALVGNKPDAAVLELRLVGPTLEVDAGAARLALAGARAAVEVLPAGGGTPVRLAAHRSIRTSRR